MTWDGIWLKEIEHAAWLLHQRRGLLHRLFWFPETTRDIPCSECMVTAEDVLTTFMFRHAIKVEKP